MHVEQQCSLVVYQFPRLFKLLITIITIVLYNEKLLDNNTSNMKVYIITV